MKEAIAKLMIATMMVDGERSPSEDKTIKTVLKVLDINDYEYDQLIQETNELEDVDDFVKWCGSSIEALANQGDVGWKAISIVSMALVAMADTKIDPSESHLIAAVAEMLNVNIESLDERRSA